MKSGLGKIVHADDGDLFRHPHTHTFKPHRSADRQAVAGRKDRRKVQSARTNAALDGSRAELRQPILNLDYKRSHVVIIQSTHRILPAFISSLDRATPAPHQEKDTPMAEAEQILGRHASRGPIAGRNA